MPRANLIYKILTDDLWRQARARGSLLGTPVDLADGFIHFSTAAQVRETAARHFKGLADLVLLGVDPESLGDALKWEPSRGGDLFPHLYVPLPVTAVKTERALELDTDGVAVLPEAEEDPA
jgi:uncharacterized protein (DUF952 family)